MHPFPLLEIQPGGAPHFLLSNPIIAYKFDINSHISLSCLNYAWIYSCLIEFSPISARQMRTQKLNDAVHFSHS
jgi:hypothetical protein